MTGLSKVTLSGGIDDLSLISINQYDTGIPRRRGMVICLHLQDHVMRNWILDFSLSERGDTAVRKATKEIGQERLGNPAWLALQ
jgi:hypothetical protein